MNNKESAIQAITELPAFARVLLVGATDTGKSTLATGAINALAASGQLPLAVVDADLGQSEIGPPAAVGLGILPSGAEPVRSLAGVPYAAGAFVGATSPLSHALETAGAAIQMAQSAAVQTPRPARILIDTPGLIAGSGASMLRAIAAIVRPHLIVALERSGSELDSILRPLEATSGEATQILRVAVGPEIGRKSPNVRATRRTARFAMHLQGARPLLVPWDSCALENTTVTYGIPLPPHELRFIGDTLSGDCLHAERLPSGILTAILADHPPPSRIANTGVLERPLRSSRVVVGLAGRFDHLLCGLAGPKGDLLGIGLLTRMDFARREMEILTRVRHPDAIARITLGYVRLRPDGREIGQVNPRQAV